MYFSDHEPVETIVGNITSFTCKSQLNVKVEHFFTFECIPFALIHIFVFIYYIAYKECTRRIGSHQYAYKADSSCILFKMMDINVKTPIFMTTLQWFWSNNIVWSGIWRKRNRFFIIQPYTFHSFHEQTGFFTIFFQKLLTFDICNRISEAYPCYIQKQNKGYKQTSHIS